MVLLRNINAMDVIISKNDEVLVYKMVGGVLDFKIFVGGQKPEQLLKQYHESINGYQLMPFWSLGLQMAKNGISNSATLLDILGSFDKLGIPVDGVWII